MYKHYLHTVKFIFNVCNKTDDYTLVLISIMYIGPLFINFSLSLVVTDAMLNNWQDHDFDHSIAINAQTLPNLC